MKTKIVLALCVLMCAACNAQEKPQDEVFNTFVQNEFQMMLDFSSIYYIDTQNLVVYYDDGDQFDMDAEFDRNPENINEDGNLILHIDKRTVNELVNRMLQWYDFDEDYEAQWYIESLFGIEEIDGAYWIRCSVYVY